MGPPPRPPRRKPGEVDPNEAPRKGRNLIRDEVIQTAAKPVIAGSEQKSRPRSSKSKDYQLLNGIRVDKKSFWIGFCFVSLVLVLAGSIPLYLVLSSRAQQPAQMAEQTPEQEGKTEEEGPLSGIEAAPLRDSFQELKSAALKRIDDPASMVEEILTGNAQATGWDKARTYSLEGTLKTSSREYLLNLFVKAPNQVRQVLTIEEMKITTIFNGASGALQAKDFTKNREMDREMTVAQNISLLMASIPSMPLWQYAENEEALRYEGKRSMHGMMCHVIVNEAHAPYTIEHFIDIDQLVERYRTMEGLDENDQTIQIEVAFSDYQRQGGFYAPSQILVHEKSAIEVNSEFTIEKWRFNHGLLPSLFQLDNS
ncbi:hypothetical protein [Cerasicoccus maritimus]|uniref:hypothetical protein n=1 Tax=Cerasicoccus maritimus TaxID=490089 RepID=UPI002852668E|nr:hypothetical protein [Cerasicoccus maritimus]